MLLNFETEAKTRGYKAKTGAKILALRPVLPIFYRFCNLTIYW